MFYSGRMIARRGRLATCGELRDAQYRDLATVRPAGEGFEGHSRRQSAEVARETRINAWAGLH